MAETLVKRNAELNDTIALIVWRVNNDYTNSFVQECVKKLDASGNKYEFIKRVFDYVCRNVNYELDTAAWDATRQQMVQQEKVYSPQTTIKNGKGDCKKMTVLIASILKAAGINALIKHVYYTGKNYTHVYVIVPWPALPNYLTVDPVNDCKWNSEVDYDYGTVYDLKGNKLMDLFTGARPANFRTNFKNNVHQTAGGLYNDMQRAMGAADVFQPQQRAQIIEELLEISGCPTLGRKRDRGKLKEKLDKLKDKFKDVGGKVGLAPMRGAFIAILKINPFKIANKMAKAWTINKNAVEGFWTKVGGKPNELKNAIVAGAHTPLSGTGAAGLAATMALASPIIIAAVKLIKDLKAAGGATGEDELDDLTEKTADAGSTVSSQDMIIVSKDVVSKDDSGSDDTTKPPALGGFTLTGLINFRKPLFTASNLLKGLFIYGPAAVYGTTHAPFIFVPLCVIGIADMTGIINITKKS